LENEVNLLVNKYREEKPKMEETTHDICEFRNWVGEFVLNNFDKEPFGG